MIELFPYLSHNSLCSSSNFPPFLIPNIMSALSHCLNSFRTAHTCSSVKTERLVTFWIISSLVQSKLLRSQCSNVTVVIKSSSDSRSLIQLRKWSMVRFICLVWIAFLQFLISVVEFRYLMHVFVQDPTEWIRPRPLIFVS